jgi:hypothetical protein
MRIRKITWLALFIVIAGLAILIHSALAWNPEPVEDDHTVFMPGTQPEHISIFDSPDNCDSCHGGYDEKIESDFSWRGSMMAQAARDPLWLATITVAGQDAIWAVGNPNALDLCIRCHSPTGWLEGRSDPTNVSLLTGDDFWGVQCDFCHKMIDPFAELGQPDVPADSDPNAIALAQATKTRDISVLLNHTMFNGTSFLNITTNLPTYYGNGMLPNYVESGGGQFFIDNSSAKRGQLYDTSPMHDFNYSRFHDSKYFCSSCHDVSNSVLASVVFGNDTPERLSPQAYFHVERTNSEFQISAYGSGGAEAQIEGVDFANKCQDCHMKEVTGKATRFPSSPERPDLSKHDFSGGNQWMQRILASIDHDSSNFDQYNYDILSGAKYNGAQIDVQGIQGYGDQLLAGSYKSINQLEDAANLTLKNETVDEITLIVNNNAGHKLISGFPEGRRMFLNIKFYNATGYLLGEINPYEPLFTIQDTNGDEQYVSGGNLTKTHNEMVWECEMTSSLSGEEKTFHFVLGTDRYKDNRIPPKGFNTSEMYSRMIQPRWEGEDAPDYFTADEYAGGYDRLIIDKPQDTAYWNATLYYQTTSREYIEFLRDEINGNGNTLQGIGAGGDPPYLVQSDPFFSNLKGWGDAIWDLWLHNNGSAPVVMDKYYRLPTSDIDFDSDDLSDVWELLWFGNLSQNPEGDFDSDGLSNIQEYSNATNPKSVDTDFDGMPDLWEIENLLDPNLDDSTGNADLDGLLNLAEYENGTDPNSGDTDSDGMEDGWEVEYDLDPKNNDANQDNDVDGLSNLAEFINNTNPNLNDTDSDGMPDGWEVENLLDPTIDDANEDPDKDDFNNLQEFQEGTDPQDAGDHPKEPKGQESILEKYLWILVPFICIIILLLIFIMIRKKQTMELEDIKGEEKEEDIKEENEE